MFSSEWAFDNDKKEIEGERWGHGASLEETVCRGTQAILCVRGCVMSVCVSTHASVSAQPNEAPVHTSFFV